MLNAPAWHNGAPFSKEAPMRLLRGSAVAVVVALSLSLSPSPAAQAAPRVRLTWVAVTTWLLEIGDTRLLLDAYFSRPSAPLFLPGSGGAYTFEPKPSDRATVERMLDALNIRPGSLDYILSGHSHYDHSLDIPMVAQMTAAKVVGPRRPASRCRLRVCRRSSALSSMAVRSSR